MSGFGEDWLTLREPADHRARSVELDRQLLGWRRGQGALGVMDLGSGTGSNLRHLAPRLEGVQHWRLVDHDSRLLEAVEAHTRPWALERGLVLEREGEELGL
ncbi:MAG: methyltransferase type 12, partial [Candidatus Competibacteraceae bacterium]|nr:methyltransferase type 12 [Candidatus Competibacteraceae bacterium]